jgi:DNA modification methylase
MIRNSSRPGEIVYDPFLGSGSTILAADQLDRVGYGVEIDPGYVGRGITEALPIDGYTAQAYLWLAPI